MVGDCHDETSASSIAVIFGSRRVSILTGSPISGGGGHPGYCGESKKDVRSYHVGRPLRALETDLKRPKTSRIVLDGHLMA